MNIVKIKSNILFNKNLIMKNFNFMFLLLMCIVCASCNSRESSNDIKFETLEGTIQKPVTFEESPYDSISIEYKIAWPVGGNAEVEAYSGAWVKNDMTHGSGIRNAKKTLEQLRDAIADKMAKDENSTFKNRITV